MYMDRRLQLLLDQARYDRVKLEADRSGRSVAAVIREAIDQRFAKDEASRRLAIGRLLDMTAGADEGHEPDWPEIKADFESDVLARLP